jgi:penicillin-binding protein 2
MARPSWERLASFLALLASLTIGCAEQSDRASTKSPRISAPAPNTLAPATSTLEPSPSAPATSYVEALRAKLPPGATLALDVRLQAVAETAVRDTERAGAIVAFEPDTGTVRGVFSVPGERGDPLLTAELPASAFKPFTAIAGLEAGVLTETTQKECTGVFDFGGKELRCSKSHGRETTAQAISRSCNAFFYSVATEMDHARTLEVARRFGFGSRTGIELPDEAGVVPSEERYREVRGDPSSTVPLLDAIGHGEIRVTLLQLSRALAVIANGGSLLRLSVVRGAVERNVPVRPADLTLVQGALVGAIEKPDGTAHSVAIPGFSFAGKTGSADAPPRGGIGSDEDTWFVAYAPSDHPKIVVGARVERSDPAHDAKTAVKNVLEAWRARGLFLSTECPSPRASIY